MPDSRDGITNPLAYRKIHSDSNGQRYKAREMIYAKRRWSMPMAENRLLYSSYNTAFWNSDADNDGLITIGPYSDENYVGWIDVGGVETSVQNGIQTWNSAEGTLRTTEATNCSTATTVLFSFEFLPHYDRSATTFSVVLGMCASDGSAKVPARTWSLVGGNRIWAKITTSEASAYFYFIVTPDVATPGGPGVVPSWAFINAQLEFDKDEPGQFVPTTGTAIVETTTERRGVGKIHRSEWELVQENWEGVVTPREGQDQASHVIPTEDI